MNDKKSAAAHAIRGMRILLVDDSDQYLQAMKFVLEFDGAILGIAHSGAEAIALLRQQAWDWVLMDLSMPGMSGTETIARIRADAEIPPVRVIGTTGHTDRHIKEQCLAAGMDEVLIKPFQIDTLYTLLARPA